MTVEQKPAVRGSVATVVATAAVTLAIGVTVAALGGYLVPNRGGGAANVDQAAAPLESAPTAAPGIVLAPVAPDSPPPAAAPQAEPEVLFAAYEPDEDDDDADHHRGRGHDGREDGEHDDDD